MTTLEEWDGEGDSRGRGHVHAATAKSLQSCPTLCDPIPGILQARTLEWVAISFSNAYLWLIHADVWQKSTKFCKAIILQFKNKNFSVNSHICEMFQDLGGKPI